MSKNLKLPPQSRADGGGNPRGEHNKMAAVFADLLTQKSTHLSRIYIKNDLSLSISHRGSLYAKSWFWFVHSLLSCSPEKHARHRDRSRYQIRRGYLEGVEHLSHQGNGVCSKIKRVEEDWVVGWAGPEKRFEMRCTDRVRHLPGYLCSVRDLRSTECLCFLQCSRNAVFLPPAN